MIHDEGRSDLPAGRRMSFPGSERYSRLERSDRQQLSVAGVLPVSQQKLVHYSVTNSARAHGFIIGHLINRIFTCLVLIADYTEHDLMVRGRKPWRTN